MKIARLIFILGSFIILLNIGKAVSILPFKVTFILLIGFIFSVLSLINLEVGLFLLIFVVPFTQQITFTKFAQAPVDMGTDDVLIMFILFSWLATLARKKEPMFLKTSLNWPIIAFFTAAVFSFIGTYNIFGTSVVLIGLLHLFKFFEYVIVYFVVVSTIKNLKQIKKFLFMFYIVVGIIILIQFSAILRGGFFDFASPILSSHQVQTHLFSSYVYMTTTIVGTYYGFFLCILLALVLNWPVFDKVKLILVIFSFILSFAFFNSFSRSAYLGLLLSFTVFAIFRERRFFLFILLLLIFSPIVMQTAVLERITFTIPAIKPTIVLDESSAVRIVLWRQAFGVFLKNFILGTGYWTTRYVLKGYEAHSQYLAILVETGIFGFFIFCWLLFRMFKNAINLNKKADTYFLKSLGLGYIAGLTLILTTCFFSETLESFRIIGPLWFVTGLISSANRILSEKREVLETDST